MMCFRNIFLKLTQMFDAPVYVKQLGVILELTGQMGNDVHQSLHILVISSPDQR